MSRFVVNAEACTRDGICVRVCPKGLLVMQDGLPVLPGAKEASCNVCGQCLAFCPGQAISLPPFTEADTPRIDPALRISPEQAVQFLKSRRSVRLFRPEPVPREKIERILDTARLAPSGGNNQLVRWTVVERPETVRRLAELVAEWFDGTARQDPALSRRYAIDSILQRFRGGRDVILRGAPHLVLAATPAPAVWGPVDSAIALTFFDLAAHAHGVGACWAGYFTKAVASSQPMRELLRLEPDCTVHGALVFGHAQLGSHRIPPRKPLNAAWIDDL